MRFHDRDDYYDLNPEIYDSLAKEELSQRLLEYQTKQEQAASNDNNLERKRKRHRTEFISVMAAFGVLLIFCIYKLFITVNLDSLCEKYNITITDNSSKARENAIRQVQTIHFMAVLPYLAVLIFLGIIGIFIYFFIKHKNNPKTIDDYLKINPIEDESLIRDGFTPQNFHPESFADPDQKPSPYISPNNYTSEITVFLKNSDPTFDSNEFIDWCKKSFFIFWEAWSQGNIEAARIFINDDLFDKMRSLLEDNLERNRKDIYRIYNLVGCFLNRYERESGFEYLTVYLTSIHRHYVLDATRNSNIPIEGSTTEDIKTIYQLTFLRRFNLERKTNIKNGVQTIICPNCGAEVTALNAGRCEFCGSIIHASEFSWVLSDIDEYLRNTTLVDNRGVILRSGRF